MVAAQHRGMLGEPFRRIICILELVKIRSADRVVQVGNLVYRDTLIIANEMIPAVRQFPDQ